MAILEATFRKEDRARAIGAWSGLGGIAGAVGPFVGGWLVGVFADRYTDRTIVICALDNLGKGAAGQALQNANLMRVIDRSSTHGLGTATPAPGVVRHNVGNRLIVEPDEDE